MMPTPRRHNRVSQATKWFAIVGALFVHLVVVAVWELRYLGFIGDGIAVVEPSTESEEVDEDIELQTSCTGDVLLATSARAAMCLAPWRHDAAACADELEVNMYMDLSGCRTKSGDNLAQVSMVTPRAAEKLEAIDPEQLVEELAAMEKPPTPPPIPPPPQPQQQAQPQPPPPPPPRRPSQVVETAKPNTEQEPADARFLSEHNIKVEKQKVARGAVKEPMVAKSKPEELVAKKDPPKEEPSVKEKPPDLPPGQNDKAPPKPGKLSMRKPGEVSPTQETPQMARTKGATGGSRQKVVSDGFIPRKGDGAIEQLKRDPGELTKGQGGAGGGAPPVPNLRPNTEQLERALGGGSVDHLEDVENGDETALSSKRWIYASFFNRLKRQVAQNWDPQTVWRRSDPQGTKHGFKTRVTEVRVSLSPKGELAKITVVNPSGVSELDDEAVRAFHAASPFPNPPDGLVKEKLITFAFSFYFEIGQPRSSWRVIRSQ